MSSADQDYRPIRELGRGGMGTVYLAEQVRLGRLVAVKTLLPGALKDSDVAARLRREAMLLRQLSHPNVVRLLDAQLEGDKPFLVFEFIEGAEPLDALLRRNDVTRPKGVAILRDILEGLAHLHENGIIHRDIKPANILIDARGGARLIDLGLGRVINAEQTRLTQEGQVLGTLAYMPPEQLLGGQADERSDIYAVGLVAAELLSGKFIFVGEAPGGPITAPDRIQGRPLKLDERISEMTPLLARWLDRCLAITPAERHARVEDARSGLDAALKAKSTGDQVTGKVSPLLEPPGRPIRASGVTRALQPQPAAPPVKRRSLAPPLIAALAVAALVGSYVQATREPAAMTATPKPDAPVRLEESSIFRFRDTDLVLDARLTRPAQLVVHSERDRRELTRVGGADVHPSVTIGSPKYPGEPLSLTAAEEPEQQLRLDVVERRLIELALRHLATAQPAAVVTSLDRRRVRQAPGAPQLEADAVLPSGFGERIASMAPWTRKLLQQSPFDAPRVELWNRIEAWGAVEDWCAANRIAWRYRPSSLLPGASTAMLHLDTPRYARMLLELELATRAEPEQALLWGAPYRVERAESPRAWLQVLAGQVDVHAEGATEAGTSVPVPSPTTGRSEAWIGFKPAAPQGTTMLYALFDRGISLRLPQSGYQPSMFRYRRLPPGVARTGGLTIRLRVEQTPGTTRAEVQPFFGFHILLMSSHIPAGPELRPGWGSP